MTTVPTPSPPAPPISAPQHTSPQHRWGRVATVATTVASIATGLLLVTLAMTRLAATNGADATSGYSAVATTAGAVVATTSAADTTTTVASDAATGTQLTDVSDIAAAVTGSVVNVEVLMSFRGSQQIAVSGSGVILDTAGTIVTNAHVVDSGSVIDVLLADGTSYSASMIGMDSEHDIALLDIDAVDLTPIVIGSSTDLLVGDPVIAIGYPLGLEGAPTVSTGIVSALGRSLDDATISLTGVIQTDAAITEGSSGGALLDRNGKLVGITTAVGVSSVGIEGIGFAIPVERVTETIAALTAT